MVRSRQLSNLSQVCYSPHSLFDLDAMSANELHVNRCNSNLALYSCIAGFTISWYSDLITSLYSFTIAATASSVGVYTATPASSITPPINPNLTTSCYI